jgi:hypothetical protein
MNPTDKAFAVGFIYPLVAVYQLGNFSNLFGSGLSGSCLEKRKMT